jgi:hypothetical protein
MDKAELLGLLRRAIEIIEAEEGSAQDLFEAPRNCTRERILAGDYDRRAASSNAKDNALVRTLLDIWQEETGHKQAAHTPGRQKSVKQRLAQGYAPSSIAHAFIGVALSDFHMGRDRQTGGKSYNDVGQVLKIDKGQLEAHAARSQTQRQEAHTDEKEQSWTLELFDQ